ncbi:dTDP-4-dehydrorhamnose 3,5-epimerase [Shimia sp. R11_0]|uniref:dTDP-4-dehydrorhamnose 3,5-epimerase n=1 Tax=Shimia sp. R11_0 TaxID=2821096 RepID=UPI001ADCB70C|nr:dTDP-4-dehydrorhamnose 3,5-epimerase [Shimia sp. R11_0]MBO9476118.1 dTDP-4-dehydrorhamnose 3,5-epimerase [Shimia sp. R11_0]
MHVEETAIAGLKVLTPRRFGDSRGFFSESWNKKTLSDHGIDLEFVQDNHSLSAKAGTVRGLHFQAPPHAQAKLVRCGRGALLDVAVDIRLNSPTYGRWFAVELSAQNGRQILIPAGFAHGFVTLVEDTEIIYKCTDYYAPDCDRSLRFDDPDLAIDWGLRREEAILSEKDAMAPALSDIKSPFEWGVSY